VRAKRRKCALASCGKPFVADHHLMRYCSPECRKEGDRAGKKESIRRVRGSRLAPVPAKDMGLPLCARCGQRPRSARLRMLCEACFSYATNRDGPYCEQGAGCGHKVACRSSKYAVGSTPGKGA
jgi:hypothetical protein